jgi:hypothetical protein
MKEEKDPRFSPDPKVRRPALEEEIRNAYAARNYPAAHAALEDWWKMAGMETSDAAFLNLLGDICQRVEDHNRGDLIGEYLTAHGTSVQSARALRLLSRRWFGTPHQIRLNDLYRRVLERYPDLRDDQEMDELGRKLAGH